VRAVEAAHIAWRPLGRLLVEQGLLTSNELELALAKQQETGLRLGETIVKCGFVSGPQLASALAAQYGIELMTETGFGTGLRSEIQRRHESDRRRVVQLVPAPADAPDLDETVAIAITEPDPAPAEPTLLAQLEEQWAKLAAAEEALSERERELAELTRDNRRREQEIRQLEELNARLRSQIEELRLVPAEAVELLDEAPAVPETHLVFAQLDGRYELLTCDGPPPAPRTPLTLPDLDEGTFVVKGRRSSPLPGDARPCVVVERAA
jgi:hypothetical protein